MLAPNVISILGTVENPPEGFNTGSCDPPTAYIRPEDGCILVEVYIDPIGSKLPVINPLGAALGNNPVFPIAPGFTPIIP